MNRKDDRFRVSREVGERLRRLRIRAGLTQAQLAEATGRGWANTMVSRLESGKYPNPGIAVVADYLRACRASFDELSDLLNEYTSRPTPSELAAQKVVAKVLEQLPSEIATQAVKYDAKTTVARLAAGAPALPAGERVKRVLNLAAAASRRKRLDILAKYLEGELGHGLVAIERQFLNRQARKFWGALTSTRGKEPDARVRRMAHAVGDGIAENVLSAADVRLIRDRVVELFEKMEAAGALGPVTPAKPYHRPTASEREMRGATPAQIARQAFIATALSDAYGAVQTKDRPRSEWIAWDLWLTSLASAA